RIDEDQDGEDDRDHGCREQTGEVPDDEVAPGDRPGDRPVWGVAPGAGLDFACDGWMTPCVSGRRNWSIRPKSTTGSDRTWWPRAVARRAHRRSGPVPEPVPEEE